jgi:hypothetical protein
MKDVALNRALAAAVKAARAAGKLILANWHKTKRVNLADIHDIKLELDAPGGKFRMVADNGLLRQKLKLGSLMN